MKHKGKPLYKYARNGQFIDKEPRKIEIKKIILNKEDLKIFKNGGRVKMNSKSIDLVRIYDQSKDFIGIGSIFDNQLKHKQLV